MESRHNAVAPEYRVTIADWHAHIYFDADEADAARELGETMCAVLGVAMGRVHSVPVGSHPRGSRQKTIAQDQIAKALRWLVQPAAGSPSSCTRTVATIGAITPRMSSGWTRANCSI